MSGNYEQAIEIGLENYKDDSTNLTTLDYLGQCYLFLNDIENAKLYYDKYKSGLKTFPIFPKYRTVFDSTLPSYWPTNWLNLDIFPILHMIYIEKKLGNIELAETYRKLILDNMEEMIKCKDDILDYYTVDMNYVLEDYLAEYKLACLYATFNENEKAIEHIKNILKRKPNPVWLVNYLKDNPMLDPIREYPDFIRVLNYMGKEYENEKKKVEQLIVENQSIIP